VDALTALLFGKLFDRGGMAALIIGVVLSAAQPARDRSTPR
jgi:hypothetical protein